MASSTSTPVTAVNFIFRRNNEPASKAIHLSHPIQNFLLDPETRRRMPNYEDQFLKAADPVLSKHYVEYPPATPAPCMNGCGTLTTQTLQLPNTTLPPPLTDPTVGVLVLPLCDKPACARTGGKRMQIFLMQSLAEQDKAARTDCEVCGKVEGAKKCAGCSWLSYCSRECQKKDWRRHKAFCTPKKPELPSGPTLYGEGDRPITQEDLDAYGFTTMRM